MTDAAALRAELKALLEAATGFTWYPAGRVPSRLPETGGTIDPYGLLASGLGGLFDEVTACGDQAVGSVIFDFQTTVVAADPWIALDAAQPTRDALLNARVGNGTVRPNPQGFTVDAPIPDNSTVPSRHMYPEQWRLITN